MFQEQGISLLLASRFVERVHRAVANSHRNPDALGVHFVEMFAVVAGRAAKRCAFEAHAERAFVRVEHRFHLSAIIRRHLPKPHDLPHDLGVVPDSLGLGVDIADVVADALLFPFETLDPLNQETEAIIGNFGHFRFLSNAVWRGRIHAGGSGRKKGDHRPVGATGMNAPSSLFRGRHVPRRGHCAAAFALRRFAAAACDARMRCC